MSAVPPYAGQLQFFVAVPQMSGGGCGVVPPYLIVEPGPTPEDGCSSMPPVNGQDQTDFIVLEDILPETGCSVRPPETGQDQGSIDAPFGVRPPETGCAIIASYTGQSQTSKLDASITPETEDGCSALAPFSGQAQTDSIKVPASIAYQQVWEESCWNMPPYAAIYPQPAEEPTIHKLSERQAIFGPTAYEAYREATR